MFKLLKCKNCSERNQFNFNFWISKIDAVGFIFLSAILTLPVWAVSSLIESSMFFTYLIVGFAIFLEYTEKEYKVVALLVLELFIEVWIFSSIVGHTSLVVITAFLVTFYQVGKKVYGFFFMCVNYKLQLNVRCNSCDIEAKNIILPATPKES